MLMPTFDPVPNQSQFLRILSLGDLTLLLELAECWGCYAYNEPVDFLTLVARMSRRVLKSDSDPEPLQQ